MSKRNYVNLQEQEHHHKSVSPEKINKSPGVKRRRILEEDMFCWGKTNNGQLGLGDIEEAFVFAPRQLRFEKAAEVIQVACGSSHTLLVTKSGELYSCGSNDFGQLGHNKSGYKPEKIDALEHHFITSAACGAKFSMALTDWGQVLTWGSDTHGQLGNAEAEMQRIPKVVKGLAKVQIVQISCGPRHCLALAKNGELYSWGANDFGQLGLGTATFCEERPNLIQFFQGLPIRCIASGGGHNLAVTTSGAVYGWGRNDCGQLGLNDDKARSHPCQLRTIRSAQVVYVACGEDFSVFLTKDGGLFSCGLGKNGQLGHNEQLNCYVPRMISELMGSPVTQVASGSRHTLVFLPSKGALGRVLAFGHGSAGQLGTKLIRNTSTPQVVRGPWYSSKKTEPPSYVVKSIFSGGDHCFTTVTQLKDEVPADDFRVTKPETQILSLTLDKAMMMEKMTTHERIDIDLLSYVEIAFASSACFNNSFLKDNDEKFNCSAHNSGIDLAALEEFFTTISRVENISMKELLLTFVQENLLPSLTPSPADVEALRVYVTLVYYHEFDNPKHYINLHNRFAQSYLNLSAEAAKIVAMWWLEAPVEYFERLIRIFKNVVLYGISKAAANVPEMLQYDENLLVTLQMLQVLHKLNRDVDGLKVPHETFYLPELSEKVDLRTDYFKWLMMRDPALKQSFYFCSYPFLFDAKAKTLILQVDQAMQMQTAMSQAAQALGYHAIPPEPAPISTFLYFEVSRDKIVEDTLRELGKYDNKELKRPLKVKFKGEEAEDAGGVTKEFFLLLIKEILDPKYGMFEFYEETKTLWFNCASFEEDIMYYLIGVLCGLAIYNFTIINLPFPLAIYKKLLNEPVGLQDLEGLSPTLARSLQQLLDYEEPDLEEVFLLTFEMTKEIYGVVKAIPLKPDGNLIPVTQENKKEYVDLYVDMVLTRSVEKQLKAFTAGVHRVCGGRVLELFQAHEFMEVVIGNEDYDWNAMERQAEYRNGYTANDRTIRYFWEVFHELPLEEKKKFLLFLTGTDRIPLQGMEGMKILIQPVSDDRCLPVAHTCFNMLDLPRYKTKAKLKYKLLQAIQQTYGFSLV